ncbi:hypothetical protein ACFT0G_06000 [Streptomyces sp. NPDC057020]|uniref:hypothetical protein n=1 Tax=unclassified Streptomyces TaxID=2593676 RepID=UPI003624B1DC
MPITPSTADLIAALDRLGGTATTDQIAAEATGGPVGASLRISVHQRLQDARRQVREGTLGPTSARRTVWHLRAEADA